MQPATSPSTPAFDPAQPGTPESEWLSLLRQSPNWTPQNGPLVVVSPHPDDEILAAGGLIHCWANGGRAVTVVSVTDGEAAFPSWHGLDLVRRDELKNALRHLSFNHVTVVRLGIPDGRVAAHANRLRNALLAVIDAKATLVAPYERDGHPDHEAVGQVCCCLAQSHGVPLARYPIWLWHHAEPRTLTAQRWGRFVLSVEARRAKTRATRCFQSQLGSAHRQAILPPHVLEHFDRSFEAFLL